MYNSLFAGDASDFAEQVFRTFDTDGNGTVDFKEFIVGLCVSGSTDFNTKLTWAFQMYDLNGDGFISWDEMRHMISVSKIFHERAYYNWASIRENLSSGVCEQQKVQTSLRIRAV